MIRQKDADGNVVLVLTPREVPSLLAICVAGGRAYGYQIARLTDVDMEVANDLLAASMLLSDEDLIDGLMAPHADHDTDDHVGLLDEFTEVVTGSRKLLVKAGLVAGE